MTSHDSPRLLADVGGTYVRFVLETGPGVREHPRSLRCAEHADFQAAVTAYLAPLAGVGAVHHAAVAIANPVEGDLVRMTNYHWRFSIEQMRERLGLDTLVVVNDFTALAMAIPRLKPGDCRQVGGGCAREGGVAGVLGAGTGLGVSGLVPTRDGWVSLGSEGGHASFSPLDVREVAILQHAWAQHPHVSFERLLSGSGLQLIHQALAARAGCAAAPLGAREISQRALDGSDALCSETLEAFCCILGTAAANLALTLGALGGVYIGGNIVPRLGGWFERSGFRARFEAKGRFHDYLAEIPTFVITAEDATFEGVSAILEAQLERLGSSGSSMVERVRRARGSLSPAERRVAELVLQHPRQVLNGPIADIARASEVSQPTVIRFCRSLGCEGLSDFKLRLASGLSGTIPLTHSHVTGGDSMLELGAKVLGNTASAILQVRDQLHRGALDRAVELLVQAQRIEFYAVGHFVVVAQDAQMKFLRFGVPSVAYSDTRQQQLAARVLRPQDVAVLISPNGRVEELLQVAEAAQASGATVVAITGGQTPLARKADVVLIVDPVEDIATQVPMIGRILYLLIVDILAVGVAMRRGAVPAVADDEATPLPQPRAVTSGPGVSIASPLARLVSHSR